jgi:hypothetical protein
MRMFDYLLFNDRLGRLSTRETEYWQMMFRKILKVGEEFEVQVPQDKSLHNVHDRFARSFNPSRSLHHHGQYGVKEVMTDGSVPHGLEVVTVGKRFDWKTFYEMNEHIMNIFREHDTYTSHHTGMHIHLLAGYTNNDITELERNVPEIILANFYQLHRIFAPELYWIASGGSQDYAITRYLLFRRPPFDFSATNTPMSIITEEMRERYGKYQMFNMNHCRFARGRELSTFHVEVRHPDTHLSPAVSSALVALEVGLLYKAIDLSQCGIISIKQDEYDFKKLIFDKFVNFGTGDRESDSTDLDVDDIENLQVRTSAMVRWLKSELYNINPVAYEILKKISVTPSALMRIDGMSWNQIDEKLYTPRMVDRENVDKLLEMIVLQQITDCTDNGEWLGKASERLRLPIEKTNQLLRDIGMERLVSFDDELGGYMFKQIV